MCQSESQQAGVAKLVAEYLLYCLQVSHRSGSRFVHRFGDWFWLPVGLRNPVGGGWVQPVLE